MNFNRFRVLTEQVNFINDYHTLGVPRSQMPQIKSFRVPDFERHLESLGYKVERMKVEADKLKLTQADINMNKVVGMAQNIDRIERKFVIMSSDGYILDGHHRVFALRVARPKEKVDVHRVNVKIRELLDLANRWDGSIREN